MNLRVLGSLLLLLTACASAAGPDDGAASAAVSDDSGFGPVQTKVLAALRKTGQAEGTTWWRTAGTFDAGWVQPTPSLDVLGKTYAEWSHADDCKPEDAGCDPAFGVLDCAADSDCTRGTCVAAHAAGGQGLCLGAADNRWDVMFDIMTSAQSYVDVAFLGPPTGRFLTAMTSAVTELQRQKRAVMVRVLYSHIITTSIGDTKASDVLTALTSGLPAAASDATVKVFVGRSDGILRWNHSKFVAADEGDVLFGGAEAGAENYLAEDPVFDFNIRGTGDITRVAHLQANHVWKDICSSDTNQYAGYAPSGETCAKDYEPPAATAAGRPVIAVANDYYTVGTDPALVAIIDSATTTLKISQQDIYSALGSKISSALLRALARGVEVSVVKSGKDEGAPDPQAWAQYSAKKTATKLLGDATWSWKSLGFPSKDAATAAVCGHLHIAHLHYATAEDKYPDGRFINYHAKNILADDQVVYIGSANAYATTPTTLAEFGVVMEGGDALAEYLDYWSRVWEQSSPFVATADGCQ